mgnify:CR=1 FL=1
MTLDPLAVDGIDSDRAGVVAEVTACFEGYEDALRRNDVDVRTAMFWDDPAVVRFGVDDHQFGAA